MLFKNNRGMALINFFIGIMIVVIISIAVAIPIVQDTITNVTTAGVNETPAITGTSATLLGYVPLLLVVVVIVAIVSAVK